MILSDNHIHTSFSTDSNEAMENQVLKGIELGFTSMTFTDHMDLNYPFLEEYKDLPQPIFVFDTNAYQKEIDRLNEKYGNRIQIKKGIEMGIKPDMLESGKALFNDNSFDFVIASTHLIENSDPYYTEFWEGKDVKSCLKTYYETILNNISIWSDYDVVGHIDYMVRYAPDVRALATESAIKKSSTLAENEAPATKSTVENNTFSTTPLDQALENHLDDNWNLIEEILKKVVSDGKGIEINTAGFKYNLGHPNPHERILKLYKALGGEIITVGSDAHESKYLGHEFKRAEDILLNTGFKYYTEYEKRAPKFIALSY